MADETLIKVANEKINLGRKTTVEFMFMEGLISCVKQHEVGKGKLNANLRSMELAKLDGTDLQPDLWHLVSSVLRGEKLEKLK